MESEQAARIKEKQATKLSPNDGFFISSHLSLNPKCLWAIIGPRENLEGPSVDPFRVPDLDDPYEQEKLNKGLFSQVNDIESHQMYNSLEQRLKAVEDRNVLKRLNPDDLSLVPNLVLPPSSKC